MTAREAAVAAVLAEHEWRWNMRQQRPLLTCACGDELIPARSSGVAMLKDHRAHLAAAIIAALDTPTPATTETGTYPCCGECDPGCSGRHESRCHCQTMELLAIADEGAARARGEGL